jgi:hypothetical protein
MAREMSGLRRVLAIVLMAGAAWMGTLLPGPWGAIDRAALSSVRWSAPAALLLLAAASAAWLALRPRPIDVADHEEPLLDSPRVPACRSPRPVVVLAGLEPSAGVSTLAFNLAVTAAADGMSPRPVCVLRDCPLARALELDPQPLERYLGVHHEVDPDLVNLAVRHPSGCELLCLGGGQEHLPSLVAELARHYDAVLVDGALGERPLMDVVTEMADVLVLVGLPAASSVRSAGTWIERAWAMSLQDRTILLVNRVVAHEPPPRELELAFPHTAELPDEPRIADADRDGIPWSLDRRQPASQQLAAIAAQLMLAGHDDGVGHAA